MAYSTANPPAVVYAHPQFRHWVYQSADTMATVRAAGYISNAADLGMKSGDTIFVIQMDGDDAVAATLSFAIAIATNGSADLVDGTAITATNTD